MKKVYIVYWIVRKCPSQDVPLQFFSTKKKAQQFIDKLLEERRGSPEDLYIEDFPVDMPLKPRPNLIVDEQI